MKRLSQFGDWGKELEKKALSDLTLRFSEMFESIDFAQACQRPDGSVYGTTGTCRKGKPIPQYQEDYWVVLNRGAVIAALNPEI